MADRLCLLIFSGIETNSRSLEQTTRI